MMVIFSPAKPTRLFFLGLLFACGLAACSPDGAAVAEADYPAKILGNWQGEVAGDNETMSFAADGGFVSLVRSDGFISTTLGQGVTGKIRGTWAINGNSITLIITSTEHDRVLNSRAIATIETLKTNALVVKSSTGITSTFIRQSSRSSNRIEGVTGTAVRLISVAKRGTLRWTRQDQDEFGFLVYAARFVRSAYRYLGCIKVSWKSRQQPGG